MAYMPSRRIGALPAALPARRGGVFGLQELAGILEIVAGGDAAQCLAGGKRFAVAGIDVADLALRHRDERNFVQPIHPAPQADVKAAAQHVRLEAGFIAQRDQSALLDGAGARPELFDDADAIVGDVAQAGKFDQRSDRRGDCQKNQAVLRRFGKAGPDVAIRKDMSQKHGESPFGPMGENALARDSFYYTSWTA